MHVREDISVTERLWMWICDLTVYLRLLLITFTILTLLTLFSLPYVEPGTASYTIVLANLGLNISGILAIVVLLRACGKRKRR